MTALYANSVRLGKHQTGRDRLKAVHRYLKHRL